MAELDKETTQIIIGAVAPLIASAVFAVGVATAEAIIEMVAATNYEDKGLTGNTEIHPTSDQVNISSSDVAASDKEGKLSHDTVSAQSGDIAAAATDADAANAEATAADSGATALRTKAGASDIEVKALKMT
ncbi:MAG: hypothetical protein LBV68_06290 [Spirochaetaceae bacterium]|jgi:hypothetical protein|nr:hypothetical protein [Spirochaetaceae bacterium]